MTHNDGKSGPPGLFPATGWSRIRRASRADKELSSAAIGEIYRLYWYPTFVTARSKYQFDHHKAEDVTQGFWVWVLRNGIIARAVPERGRFRSFLLTCFERYLHHEWRRESAQKRGGGVHHVSIHSDDWSERFEREMGTFASPDEHLKHVWENASLEAAFQEVESAWAACGRQKLFSTLKAHLLNDAARGGIGPIAAELNLTEGNVRQQLFRLRQDLREAGRRWLGKSG